MRDAYTKPGNYNSGSSLRAGKQSAFDRKMSETAAKERLIESRQPTQDPHISTELQSRGANSTSISSFQERCFLSFPPSPSSPTFQLPSQLTPKGRLVGKRGDLRVVSKNVPHKVKLYASDLFTTVIDLHWNWVLLLFLLSYIVSWLLFAVIWWMIMRLRGIGVCFENVSTGHFVFLSLVSLVFFLGWGPKLVQGLLNRGGPITLGWGSRPLPLF